MKSGWQEIELGTISPVSNRKVTEFLGECRYYATGAVGAEGELSDPEIVTFFERPSRAGCMPEVADVGFARMKGTKKVVLIDETLKGCLFSTGFCFLVPEPSLDPRFLFYFLISDKFQNAKDEASGEGIMGGIKNAAVSLISLPLPSLQEQLRVVKMLDEALDGIEAVRANARQNLQNANDIYASLLENWFQNSTDIYETVELGKLIQTLTDYHANGGYEILKRNVELKTDEDFAWMVRSTDFENQFQNKMRYITEASYNFLTKSKVFGGEIIMSKIGNAGKVYLMPDVSRPCSLAMNLFLIRLNEDKTSNEYVFHFLKSRGGERQIRSRLKGVATQTITKESVRSLAIPLAPKDVQDRFVQKLRQVETEVRKLEDVYRKEIETLEAIKKALFKQVFDLASPSK